MKKLLFLLACCLLGACSVTTQPDGLVCIWEKLTPVGTVTVTAGKTSFVEARLRCNRHVDGFEITVDGKHYAYQSGPYIKLALEGGYAEREVCIKGMLSYNYVSACATVRVQGDGTCTETPEINVKDLVWLPSAIKMWQIPRVDPSGFIYFAGYEPTTVVSGPLCLEETNWYLLESTLNGKSVRGWVRFSVNGTVFMYPKK